MSLCYGYKNNFTEAKNFVKQGFSVCVKNCSDRFLLHAQFSLGIISFEQRNFHEAETQFLKSYALAKKLNNERFQLDNIVYLLRIYISRNQMKEAENYLAEAESLITLGTPYSPEMIDIYSQLFSLYSRSGNLEKVAFYQNKYIALRDSIYNDALTTNLMKLEAEHLEKENKARIDSQNKILELNEEVIFRQKFLNIFIGVIAILLVALAILLVKSNRAETKSESTS